MGAGGIGDCSDTLIVVGDSKEVTLVVPGTVASILVTGVLLTT